MNFYKYQGTGNDFVMIDDRAEDFDLKDLARIQRLCDRKFGIGADGLILIRNHPDFDFEMIYFNADGSQSMCGNGARCTVAFAAFLGIISNETKFLAIDGSHEALIQNNQVEVRMGDVKGIKREGDDFFLNTGSPHHIKFVNEVNEYPVYDQGKSIRYDPKYNPGGTNVNFVEKLTENEIFVRTYERGVEDETLSCGTGITAAALAFAPQSQNATIQIQTLGGKLAVRFSANEDGSFRDIWLIGPALQVYSGTINC
jgi:diaminopimelate epimerase